MGLLGVVKQLRFRCRAAYYQGPQLGMHMMVDDIMTALFAYAGAPLSAKSIYDMLFHRHKLFLAHTIKAHLCIICWDKSEYVPREKRLLQEKRLADFLARGVKERKEQKGYQPGADKYTLYPDGCVICDAGVRHPDGRVELIDMGRLMMTRSLRPSFYNYLMNCMVQDPEWPAHANIIVDSSLFGGIPQLFLPGSIPDDQVKVDVSCLIPLPTLKNCLGEAEKAAIWWSRLMINSFPEDCCVVRAIDGDVIPMLVHHYWNDQKNADRVRWISKDGRCHLGNLLRCLKRMGATRDYFVAACILSGCDYFEKKFATDQIGHDILWDAAVASAPYVRARPDCFAGYSELLRFVFAQAYQAKPKAVPVKRVKGQPAKKRVLIKNMTPAQLAKHKMDTAESKERKKIENKEAERLKYLNWPQPKGPTKAPDYKALSRLADGSASGNKVKRLQSDEELVDRARNFLFTFHYWTNVRNEPSTVATNAALAAMYEGWYKHHLRDPIEVPKLERDLIEIDD